MDESLSIIISVVDQATQALASIGEELGSLAGTAAGKGALMTTALTAPLAAIGGLAAHVAGDFEQQMNILSLAAKGSGTSLEELRQSALKVGADTHLVGIDAAEAADAMTNFYKAGLDTNEIFGDMQGYLQGTTELAGALRAAIDLAAASELDLGQASDAVTIAMRTFGLSASDAEDIANSFVQAADASVADVGDLTEALKNVGPTAASFGWSLQDVNTALALLSSRGIKGAEAGTALKSMMVNLMRPTKQVKQALKELNVSLYDEQGHLKSLPEIIGDLSGALDTNATVTRYVGGATKEQSKLLKQYESRIRSAREAIEEYEKGVRGSNLSEKAKAKRIAELNAKIALYSGKLRELRSQIEPVRKVTRKLTDEERNQYIQILAGTYGMKALNTLLSEGVEGWGEMADSIEHANTAQEAAAARTKGFKAAMEQLTGSVQTLLIEAGTPLIQDFLTPAVQWMTNLLSSIDLQHAGWLKMALGMGIAAAAAGPVMMVLGAIAGGLAMLLSPMGLVVAAVALLAAAWMNDWGGIRETTAAVWAAVQPVLAEAGSWIGEHLPQALSFLQSVWTTVLQAISAFTGFVLTELSAWWQEHGNNVVFIVQTFLGTVQTIVTTVLGAIQTFWNAYGQQILALTRAIWSGIKIYIDGVLKVIGALIDAFAAALRGDWKAVGEDLKKAWKAAWDTVKQIVATVGPAIVVLIGKIATDARNKFMSIDWGGVGSAIIHGVEAGVRAAAGALAAAAADAVKAALAAAKHAVGIHSPSRVFKDEVGRNIILGIVEGLDSERERVLRSMEGLMSGLANMGMSSVAPGVVGASAGAFAAAGAGARAAGVNTVYIQYSPMFSLADEEEAVRRIAPVVKRALQEANRRVW